MFTGIIEYLGEITAIREEGTNKIFEIATPFKDEIKVDQSIAHNGICLTVTDIVSTNPGMPTIYSVTAVEETILKSSIGDWEVGTKVNIERSLKVGDRLDGHFVQGHVDDVATVAQIEERDGSWNYHFHLDEKHQQLLVNKGSICIDGVSLTVVEAAYQHFSVTIIPFTYEHTHFHQLEVGSKVNLEFDVLGKYLLKLMASRGI